MDDEEGNAKVVVHVTPSIFLMFYNIPSGIHSNGFDTKIDFFTYGDIHGCLIYIADYIQFIRSKQCIITLQL